MNCTFDSNFSDLTVLKGDKGDKGETGAKGDKGEPGVDGTDGGYYAPSVDDDGNLTWTPSADNMPAVTGANIKGDTGVTGAQGPAGADGADGVGIESVVQTTTSTEDGGTNVITVTKTDGTSSTFAVRNGSRGSVGPAGADGQPGADGKDGLDGLPGADGKSAYQFAQEAGYTGTETEFGAKLNQTTFANPFPLTFTGAASATYDGSSAVTIDLPSGGGSVSNYKTVTVVLDANASRVDISKDAEGGALSAHEVYWIALTKSATTQNEKYTILINRGWNAGDPYITPNNTTSKSTDNWFNSAYGHMIVQDGVVLSTNMNQSSGRANALGVYSKYTEITSVNFVNATFAAGCTFILIYR